MRARDGDRFWYGKEINDTRNDRLTFIDLLKIFHVGMPAQSNAPHTHSLFVVEHEQHMKLVKLHRCA